MRNICLLISVLSALALLTGTGCKPKTEAVAKASGPKGVPVTVATVTNAAWDRTVSVVGTLYAKDSATIAAQVEGQVEKTQVEFGDRISNDQQLALIDTASYEAFLQQAVGNVAKAEANLANARQNFERVSKLRSEGVASESDYDLAKSQFEQWEAELKSAHANELVARLNVERSVVKAPFDGAVAQRIVGRGDFVKIGSPLFAVVNDSVLKFIFQVPERYASYVQKKLPVSFSVDNYPGETFTGSVYLISPEINRPSRSFNVGALVTNTNFRLKASTFARGSLIIQQAVPTPVVPVESVVSFAGVTKVYVIENNVARSRAVTTGRIQGGVQEILDGVKVGDAVAVTGTSRLSDGMAVVLGGSQAGPRGLHAEEATNGGKNHGNK